MIKNLKKFRLFLFLVAHPIILASVFALKFLGVIGEPLTLLLTGLVSIEAIYIAFFMKIKLNKTVGNFKEMQQEIQDVREDGESLARMRRELIYAGHQIKSLQVDLDTLKKANSIKLSGSSHSGRSHSPAVSHF